MPAGKGGKKRPKRKVLAKAEVSPELKRENRIAFEELEDAILDIRDALRILKGNITISDCM